MLEVKGERIMKEFHTDRLKVDKRLFKAVDQTNVTGSLTSWPSAYVENTVSACTNLTSDFRAHVSPQLF